MLPWDLMQKVIVSPMRRGSVMKGGSAGASLLYVSSAPNSSQCFGEGTRREGLSPCIVHGGGWVQAQAREICAGSEHLMLCSSMLLWSMWAAPGASWMWGYRSKSPTFSIFIRNGTESHPGLWGHWFFSFPCVTCCRCPDRGGRRCGQSPGSSCVSRVPAPWHHWGYVPASAHCWRSCVCSWAGLIPWINQRFISTVPGCIRGEVDEETGCLNNKRIASGAAIPQGAKTAIGCWQDFSLALHPWVSPSPLLTYCLHHQFLTACSAAFLEGGVLDLNPLVLNELNI